MKTGFAAVLVCRAIKIRHLCFSPLVPQFGWKTCTFEPDKYNSLVTKSKNALQKMFQAPRILLIGNKSGDQSTDQGDQQTTNYRGTRFNCL
jgi:hypothetical protein